MAPRRFSDHLCSTETKPLLMKDDGGVSPGTGGGGGGGRVGQRRLSPYLTLRHLRLGLASVLRDCETLGVSLPPECAVEGADAVPDFTTECEREGKKKESTKRERGESSRAAAAAVARRGFFFFFLLRGFTPRPAPLSQPAPPHGSQGRGCPLTPPYHETQRFHGFFFKGG